MDILEHISTWHLYYEDLCCCHAYQSNEQGSVTEIYYKHLKPTAGPKGSNESHGLLILLKNLVCGGFNG